MTYAVTITVGVKEESSDAATAALHEFMGSLDGVGLISWWTFDDAPTLVAQALESDETRQPAMLDTDEQATEVEADDVA